MEAKRKGEEEAEQKKKKKEMKKEKKKEKKKKKEDYRMKKKEKKTKGIMTVRLRTTTQAAWLKNRPTERKTKKDTMDNAKTKKIMNKGLNERREGKKANKWSKKITNK